MQGTVKWFNAQKGYGFITDLEGRDVFVHHSNIVMDGFRHLNEDDIVDFEIGIGNNGKEQAVNVTPVITLAMVTHELVKEELHIMRIGDDKGVHGWYVVDVEDNPVVNKKMNLVELAAYAGFSVD